MNISAVFFIILIWTQWFWNFIHTNKRNNYKKEGELAYKEKDFPTAILKFKALTDTLHDDDDNSVLNLANSYFGIEDYIQASVYYSKLLKSKNNELNSIANLQLAIISVYKDDIRTAKVYLKKSLLVNPDNKESKFNLELLERMPDDYSSEVNDEVSQKKNKKKSSKKQQKIQESIKEGDSEKKINDSKMSLQKAESILSSVNEMELMYLQQKKRIGNVKIGKSKLPY